MPNAQTHLIAGTLIAIAFGFLMKYAFGFNGAVLLLGGIILVIASEFPDVDHNKSLPRKIMRGLVPGLVIFLTAYVYLTRHAWTEELWMQLLFVIVPLVFVISYEKFIPGHRGALHKWPGMAVMVAIVIFAGLILKMGVIEMLVLGLFAAIGFSVHILLDHLKT